jgi:hypothetical protein
MCNLNRGLSIDVSYQVSVHLAMRFQRRRLKKKSTNQKQELPKSSPLKPLGQMNRNVVGGIYGRSSLKTAHFLPIR